MEKDDCKYCKDEPLFIPAGHEEFKIYAEHLRHKHELPKD